MFICGNWPNLITSLHHLHHKLFCNFQGWLQQKPIFVWMWLFPHDFLEQVISPKNEPANNQKYRIRLSGQILLQQGCIEIQHSILSIDGHSDFFYHFMRSAWMCWNVLMNRFYSLVHVHLLLIVKIFWIFITKHLIAYGLPKFSANNSRQCQKVMFLYIICFTWDLFPGTVKVSTLPRRRLGRSFAT